MTTVVLWKSLASSTANGKRTYTRIARGRPASRCASLPPKRSAPRDSAWRAAVTEMEGDGFTFVEQRDYLVAKEERLRSAILTADEDGARRPVIKKAVEDWWACVAELFELYQIQAEEQRAVEPMPIGFLTVMARMSRLIAKSRLPNVMRFAELRKASFRHDADIAAAIVFVEAARLQKVAEKEPVRLVAWAFGVSERYVTEWIKDKRRYLPGYRAETDPGRIENAMLQAGSRYRRNKKGFSDEEELTEQK